MTAARMRLVVGLGLGSSGSGSDAEAEAERRSGSGRGRWRVRDELWLCLRRGRRPVIDRQTIEGVVHQQNGPREKEGEKEGGREG